MKRSRTTGVKYCYILKSKHSPTKFAGDHFGGLLEPHADFFPVKVLLVLLFRLLAPFGTTCKTARLLQPRASGMNKIVMAEGTYDDSNSQIGPWTSEGFHHQNAPADRCIPSKYNCFYFAHLYYL